MLLVLGGRTQGGIEGAVEKKCEDEEQHEVAERAHREPTPMAMPRRGPINFRTAALIVTQIPYCSRLASAFPRIFPNRSSIGRTEDSMISTVLFVFSVSTDLADDLAIEKHRHVEEHGEREPGHEDRDEIRVLLFPALRELPGLEAGRLREGGDLEAEMPGLHEPLRDDGLPDHALEHPHHAEIGGSSSTRIPAA